MPYASVYAKYGKGAEIDHTDGIGTKGLIHYLHGTWSSAVQDAMAMNLNDLLTVRAIPYKLQNHLTLPCDDSDTIVAIIEALAAQCRKYQIVMTGGETSIMDTVKGMDLSITMTGFMETWPSSYNPTGNILIGLPSSGIHCNGFTKVRELWNLLPIKLTTPTTIYWDTVWPWLPYIDACIHITGGGFTRLKKYLVGNQMARINDFKTRQPIFQQIYEAGNANKSLLTDEEMYTTFNCGIGMVLSVKPENVDKILSKMESEVIGSVGTDDCKKVIISSIFSDREFSL